MLKNNLKIVTQICVLYYSTTWTPSVGTASAATNQSRQSVAKPVTRTPNSSATIPITTLVSFQLSTVVYRLFVIYPFFYYISINKSFIGTFVVSDGFFSGRNSDEDKIISFYCIAVRLPGRRGS